jgi:hypothetical protein
MPSAHTDGTVDEPIDKLLHSRRRARFCLHEAILVTIQVRIAEMQLDAARDGLKSAREGVKWAKWSALGTVGATLLRWARY